MGYRHPHMGASQNLFYTCSTGGVNSPPLMSLLHLVDSESISHPRHVKLVLGEICHSQSLSYIINDDGPHQWQMLSHSSSPRRRDSSPGPFASRGLEGWTLSHLSCEATQGHRNQTCWTESQSAQHKSSRPFSLHLLSRENVFRCQTHFTDFTETLWISITLLCTPHTSKLNGETATKCSDTYNLTIDKV